MWRVVIEPTAQKELGKLDRRIQGRIMSALFRLADDPAKARNVKVLAGGGYRMRVGDYRILFTLKHEFVIVLVVKIGHRRDVYR